jgi:hypothetical protein
VKLGRAEAKKRGREEEKKPGKRGKKAVDLTMEMN